MTRAPSEGPLRTRLGWIALVAFASGFPYGFINDALPIYLRSEGAGLVKVGLVAAVSFPWTFKFIWSPLVDRIGTRRQWIVGCRRSRCWWRRPTCTPWRPDSGSCWWR